MFNLLTNTFTRRFLFFTFYLLPSAFCLLLSACHRGPQTAAELQAKLPPQYRGDIHLQGDAQAHQLVVELHDLKVRDPHLLEFGSVRYQIVAGSQVMAEGDADIHGTISAPDLDIRVESVAGVGAEAVRANTFAGHLSSDLRSGSAEWANDLGQQVKLEMKAAVP